MSTFLLNRLSWVGGEATLLVVNTVVNEVAVNGNAKIIARLSLTIVKSQLRLCIMFFISDLYEQNWETQTWAGNGNDVRNEEQHFSRWIWMDRGSRMEEDA